MKKPHESVNEAAAKLAALINPNPALRVCDVPKGYASVKSVVDVTGQSYSATSKKLMDLAQTGRADRIRVTNGKKIEWWYKVK
jgi:hypothetical protein